MMRQKKIGIIGAGPAGAFCAWRLAKAGFEVLLFDHKAPWDKPCAGGIDSIALREFPELAAIKELAKPNERVKIITATNETFYFDLSAPIYVLPRKILGEFQLNQAISAGVRFLNQKVIGFLPKNRGFEILLKNQASVDVDFLIGADGVSSMARRRFCPAWKKSDYLFTFSLLVAEGTSLPLTYKFFPGLFGYAWIFPGKNSFSLGIGCRNFQMSSRKLLSLWEKFVDSEPELQKYKPLSKSQGVKSYLIPALSFSGLKNQKVVGENWALIGDASGSAQSVSGGGIRYGLESAKLLAESILASEPELYQKRWWEMCQKELAGPSLWGPIFYHPGTQKILSYLLKRTSSAKKLVVDLLSGKRLKPRQIIFAFAKMFKEALL